MTDDRNAQRPHVPTPDDVRGVAVRRDETHRSFCDQAAQGAAVLPPSQLNVPANARYVRKTRFQPFVGLTTDWETILQATVPEGYQGRLDFLGMETSNFGPFGDDESVEWHLQCNGTLVPGWENWMGCLQPVREPIRQQTPVIFPPGSVLTITARLVPTTNGGVGDGVNAFDARVELAFWAFPL